MSSSQTLSHDKSGTGSQLVDCVRDRNQDAVKGLFKVAKRGGDRWSEPLDMVRTSLRADDRLEPALQSAVNFHWLSNNKGLDSTDCKGLHASHNYGWQQRCK